MAKHSVVRGEKSTKEGVDSLHRRRESETHHGKHRQEDKIAGSDLPTRDGRPGRDNR